MGFREESAESAGMVGRSVGRSVGGSTSRLVGDQSLLGRLLIGMFLGLSTFEKRK